MIDSIQKQLDVLCSSLLFKQLESPYGTYTIYTKALASLCTEDLHLGEPCVCVAGAFDGFHTGHQALVQKAQVLAQNKDLPLYALMFDPDPACLFEPGLTCHNLLNVQDRVRYLLNAGVQAVVVYSFTPEFASLTPHIFATGVLRDTLHVNTLVVGSNFRMGVHGKGTPVYLRDLGICGVEVFDLVRTQDKFQIPVSSTRIRELMLNNAMEEASELLGHYPSFTGVVVHGRGEGRKFGFPTANLIIDPVSCVPQQDIYACWASDGSTIWPAAVNMGRPVSFPASDDSQDFYAEANLIDCAEDLYDCELKIFFVSKIGDNQVFDSIDELKKMLLFYKTWVQDNIGSHKLEVVHDFGRGKGTCQTSN